MTPSLLFLTRVERDVQSSSLSLALVSAASSCVLSSEIVASISDTLSRAESLSSVARASLSDSSERRSEREADSCWSWKTLSWSEAQEASVCKGVFFFLCQEGAMEEGAGDLPVSVGRQNR